MAFRRLLSPVWLQPSPTGLPGFPAIPMQGLVDAHVHLIGGGLSLSRLDLRGVQSKDDFIARVCAAAGGLAPQHAACVATCQHSRDCEGGATACMFSTQPPILLLMPAFRPGGKALCEPPVAARRPTPAAAAPLQALCGRGNGCWAATGMRAGGVGSCLLPPGWTPAPRRRRPRCSCSGWMPTWAWLTRQR
jgi:hypothetical protein